MSLSSQQMARMSRLLDEALPLDTAARRAWLQSLSPDCQDLLSALRTALLGGHEASEGLGHDDVEVAGVYAQWGETQRALDRLEKAERERDPALQVLRVYWALDPVRANPRFKAIEQRMNYPP